MESAAQYLAATAPAAEGLFKILNGYGWDRMRAIVDLTKSKTRRDLEEGKTALSSKDVARGVVAGSILQIAYSAIAYHATAGHKGATVVAFESKINELIRSAPTKPRCKAVTLPKQFCIGRLLGELPIGLVIYASRNQYNHFGDARLSVVNEVIFNYLHLIFSNPRNDISFNLYDGRMFYSYEVLSALGWVDTTERRAYISYSKDMAECLKK
jgi:hypothetical protein